jgi:hypothetical protein
MPVSAWSLCCTTALVASKAVSFQAAMAGLCNESIWLIVFAFFFAKVACPMVERSKKRSLTWFNVSKGGKAEILVYQLMLVARAIQLDCWGMSLCFCCALTCLDLFSVALHSHPNTQDL